MNAGFREWRHVFKLDPERPIGDEDLERLCLSGTDAILVGGSTGVTEENTIDLLSRVRRFAVDCALEVSDPGAIVPGFDHYLIPMVLNASSAEWITRKHQRAIRAYAPLIDWREVAGEGYVVLNPDSAVARLTGADTEMDGDDLAAYADLAEKLLSLPIFYVEYSGTFGDMEAVRQAAARLSRTRLFYGGGIDGPERAAQAAAVADTVVVGNIIYANLEAALSTVAAVKPEASLR
ncbi:heptaprenylglyceryl phosphate synthase [Paenibacillus thermoaerophilus]|uniref:Heptaprenylglyceryl phosphate synthase n=1 Tax=Paenibacillus thermoaerophilus TaxID=1215385 RepID=A0ABW2V3N1_9BACL